MLDSALRTLSYFGITLSYPRMMCNIQQFCVLIFALQKDMNFEMTLHRVIQSIIQS